MMPIAAGTKVLIDTAMGTFTGTVLASGNQSQVFVYQVELDNPSSYPNLPPDATTIVVPYTSIRVDTEALTGVPPPIPPRYIL